MAKKKTVLQHMERSIKNEAFDKKFGNSEDESIEVSELQNSVAKKNVNGDDKTDSNTVEEIATEKTVSNKNKQEGKREKKRMTEIERLLSLPSPEGKSVQISFSMNEEIRDKFVKLSKLYSLQEKDIEKYDLMRLSLYDWIEKNYDKEYNKLI